MPVFLLLVLGLAFYLVAKARAARRRREQLEARFGPEIATRILAGKYWQGATTEMLVESIGRPADIKERVLKSKTKHTFCYHPTGKNRFALKIHFEDGVVVGWDDETRTM